MLSLCLVLLVAEPSSAVASAPVAADDALTRQALLMFAAGAGAAIVTVPATIALGTWLGSLSSNLIGAILPSMLLLAIIPPLAITAAAWLVGDLIQKDSVRFGPAFGVAVALQVAGIVIAAVTGVSSANAGSMAAFTAAEALVLPLGASLMMTFVRNPAKPLLAAEPRDNFERSTQARITPIMAVSF
jgi:hypothetical protein